jgi:F-type H+-transporting ATPase subunit epsilon
MSGSLTLRVLSPDKNVFDGSADEVILPSTTGQLGILPGHISLLTAIDVGVLRVRADGGWNSIALMGGFAEVDADEVTVLVNNAELGSTIDPSRYRHGRPTCIT